MIAYNARVALLGRTGSGKSHAARAIFASAAEPRLIVDPNDSKLTGLPGVVTVRSHRRGLDPAALLDDARAGGAGTIRYVPADPFGPVEYDAVYRWAFDRAPMFVWTDEVGIVAPATRPPAAFRRILVQGRKRQLGHLGCHTRPRECDPNLIAQADHVLLWPLPHPDDRAHVARLAGVAPAGLDAATDQLGRFEFVWLDVVTGRLTICPALPARPADRGPDRLDATAAAKSDASRSPVSAAAGG